MNAKRYTESIPFMLFHGISNLSNDLICLLTIRTKLKPLIIPKKQNKIFQNLATSQAKLGKNITNMYCRCWIQIDDSKNNSTCTVAGIAIKDYPILCCKRPILRVGVWPIWVGPAHCPFGQSIICTSMVTY